MLDESALRQFIGISVDDSDILACSLFRSCRLEVVGMRIEIVDQRMAMFLDLENELILSKDTVFRLHSGVPCLIMHLEESDQIKGLYNETTRELAEN